MEYRIVEAERSYELTSKVSVCLKDGWKLQGGVSVCVPDQCDSVYAQAMIRED